MTRDSKEDEAAEGPFHPMRPALFPSAFLPHRGGVEQLTWHLAREHQKREREPIVITMRDPKDLPAREIIDGVPVVRVRFRVPEPRPRHLMGWALRSRCTRRDLVELLRSREVDLVHVQCVSGNAHYARAAAEELRVPLVVSLQGELTMDATRLYQRSSQMRRNWRRLLDAADAITACSRYVLEEAEAFRGQPFGERGSVVYNGIDYAECVAASAEARARPYVLGLGRLVSQKGYDLLIQAFHDIATLCNHDLVIAGDGPERTALEEQARRLQISNRVIFLGPVDHSRALGLFAGAAAFVLASRHEPQGIVVLEAMATGCPVVAAGVGGVPEIVRDGENGYIFRGGSAEDLGRALRSCLQSGSDAMTRRACAEAREFDWSRQVDLYDDVYRRARRRHDTRR